MKKNIDTHVLGVYEATIEIHRPKEEWKTHCVEYIIATGDTKVKEYLEEKYANNQNRTCEIISILEKGELAVTTTDVLKILREKHERTIDDITYIPAEII
jgi:hypothetical protein